MPIRRFALLGMASCMAACVDASDSTVVEPPTAPLLHLSVGGQSVVKSGFGTATIDGVFSPGEWSNAATVNFAANIPAADGGGTTPATLYVKNDQTNLYLALKIARASLGLLVNPAFDFDNHHVGGLAPSEGDDGFGMSIGTFEPATFLDIFWTYQPPCPVGACGLADVGFGGTNDGSAAGSNDGVFTYIEIAHPLDDPDDAHDFSLKPGDVVGFRFGLNLGALNPGCIGPGCQADTGLPTSNFYSRSLFTDLQLATVPPLPVNIDVRPGSDVNPINLKSNGTVPVAILSTSSFDATTVDPTSVLVAGARVAQRPNGTCVSNAEDVNGDGRQDFVVHIVTSELQLGVGVVEAVLTGQTTSGQKIKGSDWVTVVPR